MSSTIFYHPCLLRNLDEAESELVMTVLREFVSNRGVAMPLESRELRRPRTCFFTAERPTTTSVDAVWEFDNGALTGTGTPSGDTLDLGGRPGTGGHHHLVTEGQGLLRMHRGSELH